METDKPYINSELKIEDLAIQVAMPVHVLSAFLNEKLGVTFSDFINKYRLDEFKKRAESKEYEHLTLLGLAFDVGFNSKSSFNRIFKKHTGQTPSKYNSGKRSTIL